MTDRAIAVSIIALLAAAVLSPVSNAQTGEGWVEETGAKVEGESGRSYLDLASVHRGEDGLVYFNESTDVTRPEEIGQKGFMKDAYDCAKDIKYMCIGSGDWRNDVKSTIHAAGDPALPIYRKYLCGDVTPADAPEFGAHEAR